jgi:hypothetical protein
VQHLPCLIRRVRAKLGDSSTEVLARLLDLRLPVLDRDVRSSVDGNSLRRPPGAAAARPAKPNRAADAVWTTWSKATVNAAQGRAYGGTPLRGGASMIRAVGSF